MDNRSGSKQKKAYYHKCANPKFLVKVLLNDSLSNCPYPISCQPFFSCSAFTIDIHWRKLKDMKTHRKPLIETVVLMVIIFPNTEGCAIVTQQEIIPNQTSLLKLVSDIFFFFKNSCHSSLFLCSFTLHTI